MKARALYIAPNRHPVNIKAKDYRELLDLDYQSFYDATHIWGEIAGAPFDYSYMVCKYYDTKKRRLSYIDYLVNQKGFNV